MNTSKKQVKEPRGSQSLIKYLKYAWLLWKKNKDRYSWLWCPICSWDLNGDNDSFINQSKDEMYWNYKCSRCGCKSQFHLFSMIPMISKHQVFTKKMKKQ